MGLVVLFVILLYLAALVGAPIIVYRFCFYKALGWGKRSRGAFAFVAFLVVFLPVFWDWIPALWVHSRYCKNESGLVVYETPEQWLELNPGVAAVLAPSQPRIEGGAERRYIQLNQRIRWEMNRTVLPLWNRKIEDRIVDTKSGKVLVRIVDFTIGNGGRIESLRDFKVWMKRNSCVPGEPRPMWSRFHLIEQEFATIGAQP